MSIQFHSASDFAHHMINRDLNSNVHDDRVITYADPADGSLGFLLLNMIQVDNATFAGKRLCDRHTNPTRRTGDQGGSSFQRQVHIINSPGTPVRQLVDGAYVSYYAP
jgi:hypothetical protein